jgi:hypothetical protein
MPCVGQPLAGLAQLLQRVQPGALELHDLGPVETMHWPRNGTRLGWALHQWLSAVVHSLARRGSKVSMHAAMTPR